jgi:hypothetical protein
MTVTTHITTIKVTKVLIKPIHGTMPVWDEDGKSMPDVFTYYERTDVKIVPVHL